VKHESFTWRTQRFDWYEKLGSQSEGWESKARLGDTVVFFSVREVEDGFSVFTTPRFADACRAPHVVDALEALLAASINSSNRYATLFAIIQ